MYFFALCGQLRSDFHDSSVGCDQLGSSCLIIDDAYFSIREYKLQFLLGLPENNAVQNGGADGHEMRPLRNYLRYEVSG